MFATTAGGTSQSETKAPDPGSPPRKLRTEGNVQAALLIHTARPIYPQRAKDNLIQGTVKLQAIIARDGTLQSIEVISGHCWLVEAAVEAVSKWRYKPTQLEGQPVEVITTIDVIFTLTR